MASNALQGRFWHEIVVCGYFNISRSDVLHFEMRDRLDQPIPMYPVMIRGPAESPYWVTLPCDSTVRLRADWCNMGPPSKPDGLEIFAQDGGCWLIRPNATNDFYLSASFTPPNDHPSSLITRSVKYFTVRHNGHVVPENNV